jgi:hypothetical protein
MDERAYRSGYAWAKEPRDSVGPRTWKFRDESVTLEHGKVRESWHSGFKCWLAKWDEVRPVPIAPTETLVNDDPVSSDG